MGFAIQLLCSFHQLHTRLGIRPQLRKMPPSGWPVNQSTGVCSFLVLAPKAVACNCKYTGFICDMTFYHSPFLSKFIYIVLPSFSYLWNKDTMASSYLKMELMGLQTMSHMTYSICSVIYASSVLFQESQQDLMWWKCLLPELSGAVTGYWVLCCLPPVDFII